MKPIFILHFKEEYASAILKSRQVLGLDADDYIDEKELPAVLNFFDKNKEKWTDLIKQDKISEYFNNDNTDSNTDVVVVNNNDVSKEEQETQEETGATEEADENSDDTPSPEEMLTRIRKDTDTAANELKSKINSDLSMATVGTEYSDHVEALRTVNTKARYSGDVSAEDDSEAKLKFLKHLSEEHEKEYPEHNVENFRIVTYGKNKDKKGVLIQEVGVRTNSAIKKSGDKLTSDSTSYNENQGSDSDTNTDTDTNTNTSTDTDTDTDTDNSNKDSGNKTDFDFKYHLNFTTLNPLSKGNSVYDLTVNAGSDNVDVLFSGDYYKVTQSGADIRFAGIVRETIESRNNVGDYGLSGDYTKGNFGAGIYGRFHHEEVEGTGTNKFTTEASAKYAETLRFAAGYESEDGAKTFITKAAIRGKQECPNKGLTFSGKIEGEYGITKLDYADAPVRNFGIKATGAISFKSSNDVKADVVGHFLFLNQKMTSPQLSFSDKAIGGSVLTNISTKDIDLLTNVSAMKTPYSEVIGGETQNSESKTSVTVSIKATLKTLSERLGLGNANLYVQYTGGNDKYNKNNIGVGLAFKP